MNKEQLLILCNDFRRSMEERLRAAKDFQSGARPDLEKSVCAIDLHCHSFFSDGFDSPTFRVLEAWRRGMKGLAVVDHDNLDGCLETIAAGTLLDITVVPGIEFYSKRAGVEILGFFPDCADFIRRKESGLFDDVIEKIRSAKTIQLHQMIARIPDALMNFGISNAEITEEDIARYVRNGLSTKGDISVILQEKYGSLLSQLGICHDVKELHAKITTRKEVIAVDLQLNLDISPENLVQTITRWGGVAVLAHPTELRTKEYLDNQALYDLLVHLRAYGLQGIEVDGFRNKICLECGRPQTEVFEEMREKINRQLSPYLPLLFTNGSDSHNQPNEQGLELGNGLHRNLRADFGMTSNLEVLRKRQKLLLKKDGVPIKSPTSSV